MEVLKSGDAPALISNIEVMSLLKERASKRASPADASQSNSENIDAPKHGPFQNRDWIESSVLSYLQSSPCGDSNVKFDDMTKLVERLQREPNSCTSDDGYGLTNTEILQILNHLPTSPVELHLLIEDLENRPGFNGEEKQVKFLKLISEYSGRQVVGVDGEDDGDGNDE